MKKSTASPQSIRWSCLSRAAGVWAWKPFWSWGCASIDSGNTIALVFKLARAIRASRRTPNVWALLTLLRERNFKNIDWRLTGGDGQAWQPFRSREFI